MGLHFFVVRMPHEVERYSVVVEDERKAAEENLKRYFADVRYIKSESSDFKDRYRFKGKRKLGNGFIRGCYFTSDSLKREQA